MTVDVGVLARTLAGHGIAAVLLRDGTVRWANDPARQAVVDPVGRTVPDDELDRRLGRQLRVQGELDGLAEGEVRDVMVELVTNRVLLCREGTVTGVVDGGPAILVSFPTEGVEATDPEHVARLETMLESTSDIIAVLDGGGRVRYANAAGGRLTGLTGQDVNGRPIDELVHHEDVEAVTERFVRGVRGEDAGAFEFRLRYADGGYRPVEAELTGRVEVDGAPAHVVTIRDISERVRRQADRHSAQRRLEALVENIEDVIVVLGPDFGVQWTSPGIETLVDAPAYTNVGQSAFNDMHPDDIGPVSTMLRELSEEPGTRGRIELRLRHARRGWRWIEALTVNRLDDPDIGGLVCTLRDITDHRDVDAELRRLHEQDRGEVARLKEADRLKDLFLATVSHELRTPLSSLRGFSAVLECHGDELDDATRADMVRRIHANAREMEEMIDQLLELARLQAGRVELDLETVRLDPAVEELLDRLTHPLREHEVVTDLGNLAVRADRRALDHVLRNLLTNAARYSDAGTRIEVGAVRAGDVVDVYVRDDGIGIHPDDHGRIFQSFYQADPGWTGRRGTGVGLNIANRYARLLSGRLRLESALGEGSTFCVRLPAAD